MDMIYVFDELIKKAGYGFKLLTEQHIRVQPRMENLKALYSRIVGVTEHEHAYLMDTLNFLNRETSVHELIHMESPPSFRSVAHAIFFQKLTFDMNMPFGRYSHIAPVKP
jgi:hypothetical protein